MQYRSCWGHPASRYNLVVHQYGSQKWYVIFIVFLLKSILLSCDELGQGCELQDECYISSPSLSAISCTLGLMWFLSPSLDSDVTNTSSTETGSSSANKSCPTPSLQSMEVSSKMHEKVLLSCAICTVWLTMICSTIVPLQRPWRWRAWPWTVWGRRRRPTTWWDEACAMTSGATSVSLLVAGHISFVCMLWLKLTLSWGVCECVSDATRPWDLTHCAEELLSFVEFSQHILSLFSSLSASLSLCLPLWLPGPSEICAHFQQISAISA